MKRLLVVLMSIFMVLGLCACSNEDTEESKEEKTIEGYSWDDCVIEIDGKIVELPISVKDFYSLGFDKVDCGYTEELQPGMSCGGNVSYKDVLFFLTVSNTNGKDSSDTLSIDDSTITGISISSKKVGIANFDVFLPGGLNILNTSVKNLKDTWGEPTSSSEDNDYYWKISDVSGVYIGANEGNTIETVEINNYLVKEK